MNFNLNKKNIVICILRFVLAIVFIYFGILQIIDQSQWIILIPETGYDSFLGFYINTIFKSKLVFLNGVFNVIIAFLLIKGFFIKAASILSAIYLFLIVVFVLGFKPIGIMNLGLVFASLILFYLINSKKYEKINY